MTYDEDKNQHDGYNKTENDYKDIIYDDIEELKWGGISSHSEIEYINKIYDKRDWMDDNDNKNSD